MAMEASLFLSVEGRREIDRSEIDNIPTPRQLG